MSFRSKVDGWLAVPLALVAVIVIGTGFYMMRDGSAAGIAAGVFTLLLTLGLLAVTVPVRYRIDPPSLVIRSGVVVMRVPLAAIRSAIPGRTALASPAWSFDRIGIEFMDNGQRRSVWIAPEPREQFYEALARATGLRREGSRLIRPDVP